MLVVDIGDNIKYNGLGGSWTNKQRTDLTIGKIYEVVDILKHQIKIINDEGKQLWFDGDSAVGNGFEKIEKQTEINFLDLLKWY
jgi:hypothetical protein